jgi:hypothetical protein
VVAPLVADSWRKLLRQSTAATETVPAGLGKHGV